MLRCPDRELGGARAARSAVPSYVAPIRQPARAGSFIGCELGSPTWCLCLLERVSSERPAPNCPAALGPRPAWRPLPPPPALQQGGQDGEAARPAGRHPSAHEGRHGEAGGQGGRREQMVEGAPPPQHVRLHTRCSAHTPAATLIPHPRCAHLSSRSMPHPALICPAPPHPVLLPRPRPAPMHACPATPLL